MALELPACPTPSEAMDTEAGGGRGGRGGRRQGREVALAAAEWMVDIPADLGRCWSMLARPAGVRCLVTSGGGETTRHTKGGHTRRFPSALPGGSRVSESAGGCELECVWVESTLTFHVLDVLRWKGLCMLDQTHELRAFWLASRLSETKAATPSSTNPCRFLHVPPQPCTASALHAAYAGDGLGYARDGLLFCHREGLYESGPSPLVLLWSDARCSDRFFDYGTAQMERALAADPDKGARWRAEEVEAAHGFAALLEVCQSEMDAGEGEEAGMQSGGGGPAACDDVQMVM
jgi:snurportin-1